MSKSRGTFINAASYLKHLDPQYLRYYYACKMGPGTEDIDLNIEDFAARVNSDLVGKLANLASRSVPMLTKKLDGKLGPLSDEGRSIVGQLQEAAQKLLIIRKALFCFRGSQDLCFSGCGQSLC